MFILISNALTLKRDLSVLFARVVAIVFSLACVSCIYILTILSLKKSVALYDGLFHTSSFTQSMHLFFILISGIILLFTGFYPRKVYVKQYSSIYNLIIYKFNYNQSKILNNMSEQYTLIEYSLIVIFIICGGVFLISTSNYISLFLAIELQSYGLYIICSLYRDSESATSGGLTYFLLGGLSSCFILLATSLLYTNSGTTYLDELYVISNLSDISTNLYLILNCWYDNYYIDISLIIMSVGLLFKVSAAPFHFWSPDVYDGIPTIVTTFVAIITKISIFSFLLELIYYTEKFVFHVSWTTSILISSLFSLIIGSILGLTQFRIKRLYAYSTISHIGFILLALNINSIESVQAYIFYIFQYTITNLNAFIILIGIGYSLYIYVYIDKQYHDNLIEKNNSPIQLISQIKGYFYINPVLSLSLSITIFSFIGIPPLIGFFAKQMVLSSALNNGYIFMAIVGILTSVIGAVYYLNVIKQMFFYNHEYEINKQLKKTKFIANIYHRHNKFKPIEFKLENITLNSSLSVTISILTLIILLFIYDPEEILSGSGILSISLFKL